MGESCLLENASGITWSFPGTYLALNLYIIDFNLTFMILGLGMSSKFCLSLRIASRGLWSMHRIRSFKPRMKNLHLERPVMTACPSPSMGWYFDSAGVQNLLPQYTVCHPEAQQPGVGSPGHEQCFWVNQYPIPSFAQSVANAVGSLVSKVRMPCSHCRKISCLEASKAACSSSDHWNKQTSWPR